MSITSKTKALYRSVSAVIDLAGDASCEQKGVSNKFRATAGALTGVGAMAFTDIAFAQDAMADVATQGKRFANLAITSMSVIVLIVAVVVVIGKVLSVVSGRSTWGDVMAAVVAGAFIAVIAGVILAAATTAAGSIAA